MNNNKINLLGINKEDKLRVNNLIALEKAIQDSGKIQDWEGYETIKDSQKNKLLKEGVPMEILRVKAKPNKNKSLAHEYDIVWKVELIDPRPLFLYLADLNYFDSQDSMLITMDIQVIMALARDGNLGSAPGLVASYEKTQLEIESN